MTAEVLPAIDPKRDPAFTFSCYIPGRPLSKGSPQPKTRRRGNVSRTIVADTPKTLRWMAEIAAYAVQERRRLEARGERSFPYEAPLHLKALFVYPRPLTGSLVTGPPVVCSGPNAVGDLDKLVRAVGDALPPGEIYLEDLRMRVAKAAVIKDDSKITRISAQKAFSDEVDGLAPGCYLELRHAEWDAAERRFHAFVSTYNRPSRNSV